MIYFKYSALYIKCRDKPRILLGYYQYKHKKPQYIYLIMLTGKLNQLFNDNQLLAYIKIY